MSKHTNKLCDTAEGGTRDLLGLFLAFFKIGITTFGGGMAMLMNLQRELVERRKWLSEDELLDYVAIAQCTPGIIMVNAATLLGAKKKGFAGSAVSTIAVVLPSFVIITLFAMIMSAYSGTAAHFAKFLIGMRISVCATTLPALIRLFKNAAKDRACLCLAFFFLGLGFFPAVFPNIVKRGAALAFLASNISSVIVILGALSGMLIWHCFKVLDGDGEKDEGGK